MIQVKNSKNYYINSRALTFSENDLDNPNRIAVSITSGTVIMVWYKGTIDYAADGNFEKWTLKGYSTKLATNSIYYIYARLSRNSPEAMVLFSVKPYALDGSVEGDNTSTPSDEYWYVRIGEVTATDGNSPREVTYDSGKLGTDQSFMESEDSSLDEMFELNKTSTPWYIIVKQWFYDLTIKKALTLMGDFVFGGKTLTGVATSEDLHPADGEEEYVPNDSDLATSGFVFGVANDRYLRKDKDDETTHKLTMQESEVKNDLHVGNDLNIGHYVHFQEKPIQDFIRYYDEEKPVTTDVSVYSGLMTDQRIKEELEGLDDVYIRKNRKDTAQKHITFEEGITVETLAKMMNLEVDELATIAQAVIPILRSSKFVDGFAGEGYQIWQAIASGDWNLTIDRLTVRKVMTVYELLIQKIRSVGGMIVVSAGNGKIKEAVIEGEMYRITFEDTNTFVEGDLMRCQEFTGNTMRYYWVEVSAVEGDSILVPVEEFEGVAPQSGDECVLMGNTTNPLRRNFLLLSATEDGQPRFDCMDGVSTKNLEGCLKVRVGALDGISDSNFPANMQPSGYGIYGNNCFLTGVFVLSNGKEVSTMFAILEGNIQAEISSLRSDILQQDSYLRNASFSDNTDYWHSSTEIYPYEETGSLLSMNANIFVQKDAYVQIESIEDRNALMILKSRIWQLNEDLVMHPTFSLYETIDADGNPTGEMLYRADSFDISFEYMAIVGGTLRVYFDGENNDGSFDTYTPLNHEEYIEAGELFSTKKISARWNGTGNFTLSFSGKIYIYNLMLNGKPMDALKEYYNSRFEMTEKKIQANANHIVETNNRLEEYHGEFTLTSEQLRSEFNKSIADSETKITEEYRGYVNQTAEGLESGFNKNISDTKSDITQSYTSLVTQTAEELRSEFSEDITDMEKGITANYTSAISTSAQKLQSEFSSDMTDLRTGITNEYKSAISLSAKELTANFESEVSDLDGRITKNTTSISTQAGQISSLTSTVQSHGNSISNHSTLISQNTKAIELRATTTTVDNLTKRVTTAESSITANANSITALSGKIKTDSNGNITNISKSGLVLESNFANLFSTQVNSQGIAKTAQLSAYVLESELGTLVSEITISADQINLTGKVKFSDLDSSTQGTINGKASSSELNTLKNSLGGLAYLNAVSLAKLDSTIIEGGFIKTSLINVNTLVAKQLYAKGTYGIFSLNSDGFIITDANGNETGKFDARMYDGYYSTSISLKQSNGMMSEISPFGITLHNGTDDFLQLSIDTLYFTSKYSTIHLGEGGGIYNFAVKNISYTPQIVSGVTTKDLVHAKDSLFLPAPNECPGKVLFVKLANSCKISCSTPFYNASNYDLVSSKQQDSRSMIYVSDGKNWIEFYCG